MEDHRLKAFCLIVELKSFSKAAEAKFMTQSAMSHLIKKLEDELGVKLLNRNGKTITPTPAGKLFYSQSKQILGQYNIMANSIYDLVKIVKGPLYIGASNTAATYLLPQVFYNFSKEYPEVLIELGVSNTERIMDDLNEGKIDIGIVEGEIKETTLFPEDIAEDEIIMIAADDNPLAGRKSLTSRDLVSQPFILPETGSGIREFIDDFLRSVKIDPADIKVSMALGSAELIIQMVQSGMGISFVSKWAAFKALKDGSVKILKMSNTKLTRKFYLVCLEKEPSGITARTFRNFIREFKFFAPF